MAEIVSLVEKLQREPHEGVVQTLETMLERAKTGEVQGLRIASCNDDGTTCGIQVGFASYAMLGMLYALTNALSGELDEAESVNVPV